jgi:hypothetical protein
MSKPESSVPSSEFASNGTMRTADPDAVVVCHRGECQRRTGSVFGVGAYFKRQHVRAEGSSSSDSNAAVGRGWAISSDAHSHNIILSCSRLS